jgi:hypothetical protein
MIRQVVQIAPVAALLAIGMPGPSAKAAGVVPALQSDQAITLVGEERRRGGERGHRSERRGDRSDRGDRDRGARTFHRDDDRDRRFRRNRDGRDVWYGFGPTYDDCDGLRRRARATQSDYWWRRYRQCVQRW